jgi:hypothetical protein
MKMTDAQSHSSASLSAAAKSDNDHDHTSVSVPIKRFLAYTKQSLKEAHAIVEMDAPRLDTDDESSTTMHTCIQLKQSAANQQWPAKFVAQYASNHHVHVHDNGNVNVEGSTTTTAAACDVHVLVSGTTPPPSPLSMPTLKQLMYTMREDSFRANHTFVTLLDEILVKAEDTHNNAEEEAAEAARRSSVMEQDHPDKEVDNIISSGPESGQTADDNDVGVDETKKEDKDEASSFWMCLASPSSTTSPAKRQQQQHKKQKQLYQSFQLLYAIEHLATHSFQMIASLLNMASSSYASSSSSLSLAASENKAHQTCYVSAKERLSYWLMNHQNKFLFLQWRLSLYMNDNKEEPDRQLLENGLLYLDACTRLLHLATDTNKSPLLDRWAKQKQQEGSNSDNNNEDEDEVIMTAFVKIHARLEEYLSHAWNRQVKPLLSDSTTS